MNVYSTNPYGKTDLSKIGHGYRNVCWVPGYGRSHGGKETGHIVLFGYDLEGNPRTFRIPFCPSVKYEVGSKTKEKGLYGKHVDTKYFDDTNDRKMWCESMERALEKTDKRILCCYNPEKEFLTSTFGKYVFGKEKDEGFNQQEMRVHFYDIEVAIEDEFPEPELAKYPINLITVYDTKDKKFHSWALSTGIHNTITDLPVELRKFDREDDLLHDYLDWHEHNYPDVMAGYNCISEESHIWTCDRIVPLKSILGNEHLVDSEIVRKFPQTFKMAYKITLNDGSSIVASKDHVFPVATIEPHRYRNSSTMEKCFSDMKVSEIIDEISTGKSVFFKTYLRDNTNPPLTWRRLVIEKIDWMLEHTDPCLRGINGIRLDWRKKSPKQYCYSRLKDIVSREDVVGFLQQSRELKIYLSHKTSIVINLDDEIDCDILHIIGVLYTDGSYYKKGKQYVFYNKNRRLLHSVVGYFDDRLRRDDRKKGNIHDGPSGVCRVRINNNTALSILHSVVYNNEGNKKIDLGVVSMFSKKQFYSFFSGLIDGDGSISENSVFFCNSNDDIDAVSELLKWNGVHVYHNENNLRIYTYFNKEIKDNLSLWVDYKKNLLSKLTVPVKVDSSARASDIRWKYGRDNSIIQKVRSIECVGTKVPMYDIETDTHYFYANGIKTHNCKFFDLIYIVNRMQNVLGKNETRRLSPVGKYRTNIEDKSNYGKKYATVKGIANIDLLFLYRDKFKVKQALDGGYNLNNVAMTEIDDAKIHYDGSMMDFYKSDFQRFWEYNVQDVNLVVKLDEKLKLIASARKIASFGCAPMEEIYGTISYVVSSLDIFARNVYNKVFLTYSKSSNRGADVDQYEGAFVFPTQAGLYKQGITGIDFNSLYPSTARVLNLSPETLVGMLITNDQEIYKDKLPYTLKYANGETQDLTEEAYNELFDKACILAKNGAVFYKHEVRQGIFAKWCENFFAMRKSYKKLLAECNEKLHSIDHNDHKNDETIRELDMLAEVYDVTQYALKILINSAYGTLGTTFSPIYDVRLAEAITLTGQFANRSTAEFLNEYFRKTYHTPDDLDITISGDTDSVTGDMELDVVVDWDTIGAKSA